MKKPEPVDIGDEDLAPTAAFRKPSRRQIRRRVGASVAKLAKPTKRPAEPKRVPQSVGLSHEKPDSRKEVFYQPHLSKGATFRDTRGDAMEVSQHGELRSAADKPKSRAKRLREERAPKRRT